MNIRKNRQIRIGSIAKEVGVEQFVIRFWEKEFEVRCKRSDGGQRFYTPKEVELFKRIKTLLHDQGFTIAGAKKILQEKSEITSEATERNSTILPAQQSSLRDTVVVEKIKELQKKLIALRDSL